METNLIVDKDGFFTSSYHCIFDPKNLELSYESANLILEDVDSAFDDAVERHNHILFRRHHIKRREDKLYKATKEPIFAPSQEAFSEVCDNYIRRSPSRYSCSPRRKYRHILGRQAIMLSESSDPIQQDISDQCNSSSTSSLSNFNTNTDVIHSLTHQLAGVALSRSESILSDSICNSTLSKSVYRAPLSISTSRCFKQISNNISSSASTSVRRGCLQLLSNQGGTSNNQSTVHSSIAPASSLVELPSTKTSYLTLSRVGQKFQRTKSPDKPSLIVTVKALKPP
ncbi:Hypothetical protein GLP15_3792 [Giardia lamblia P15]|uniref:Uncharacterized protein n=1 Tax=Giardia intestinalis (strain P15) TaxID=658858 RepID=E1F243_GIAIA|nr:Hypothetical protein GLP15_3792 [Giardia lamblia P15]